MYADFFAFEIEAKCKIEDLSHTDFPKKSDERLPHIMTSGKTQWVSK